MTLGEKLKTLREKRGWTQSQAAENLGVSSQVISNYERDYRSPDAQNLRKLAELYNTTTDYLTGLTNNPSPRGDEVPDNNSSINVAFYDGYDELSPEEQEAVKEIVKNTIETFKKMKAERANKK